VGYANVASAAPPMQRSGQRARASAPGMRTQRRVVVAAALSYLSIARRSDDQMPELSRYPRSDHPLAVACAASAPARRLLLTVVPLRHLNYHTV
jgi:hypothetical protein